MQFPISDMTQHQKILAEAGEHLDLTALGEKALKEHWAQMTPEQQKSFTEIFAKLIENIAYPRTKNFLGDQKITYEAPKPIARGVEVASMTKDKEAALDVPVVYNLYEENGQWKIYDIFLDGVSMTEDLHFQFDKMIKDGSIETLLARMNERLVQAQKATTGN